MMLSRRSLAARCGPSAASIRDIELNCRPEKFRLRTLHALDHSLGWTPGTALRLATGDPELTNDEFAQLAYESQIAPVHVPDPPIASADITDTKNNDSKYVPLGSDESSDIPDARSLDAMLFKAFGQLRADISQIKADMTLRSITDNIRDQRDIDQRIIQGMNQLEELTAELQEALYPPPIEPAEITNAVFNVLNRGRSTRPATDPDAADIGVFV